MTKLIQISDCHIDDSNMVMGVDSQKNLVNIIQKISHLDFDALLISGDLTHNGTANSYKKLKQILLPIKKPIYVIKGNHDNDKNLSYYFYNNLFNSFKLNNWEIIKINSVQDNKTSGHVNKKDLQILKKTLTQSSSEYVIIVLHHPIMPMNSSWDDKLSLENPSDLFKILNQYKKIKCVVFGHAHEASYFSHQQFDIISCPSTAVQFNDESRIGFNQFDLEDSGNLTQKTYWI